MRPITAICTSDAESITVRGRDLCRDLIGKIGFTDYFFLLLMGKEPTEQQRFFVNALLVAISEHGLVPSVAAARMTYAAAPEALQGAVAAGLLGSGSVVLGSAEAAGRFLHELVQAAQGKDAATVARERDCRNAQDENRHPGLRSSATCGRRSAREQCFWRWQRSAGSMGRILPCCARWKACCPMRWEELPINVNGAIPAILLEIGFPVNAMKGVAILARTASLLAHLREEAERPIGFVMAHGAAEAIGYDGEGGN